jgi:uncharacterized protein (DUF433 family)
VAEYRVFSAASLFGKESKMTHDLVVCDPKVMLGKPVIRGTRITIEIILEKLGAGESIEQILEAYPALTRGAIQAACAYAVGVLRTDIVYPANEALG